MRGGEMENRGFGGGPDEARGWKGGGLWGGMVLEVFAAPVISWVGMGWNRGPWRTSSTSTLWFHGGEWVTSGDLGGLPNLNSMVLWWGWVGLGDLGGLPNLNSMVPRWGWVSLVTLENFLNLYGSMVGMGQIW